MKFKAALLVLFLSVSLLAPAQKIRTVSNAADPYVYVVPDDMSPAQARQVAVQKAQIELLAKEFGTVVSQSTTSHVTVNDDEAHKDFSVLGTTDVKGEWI